MNPLRKLFANQGSATIGLPEGVVPTPALDTEIEAAGQQETQSNVIALRSPASLINVAPEAPQQPKQVLVKGLIGSELVRAFFDQNLNRPGFTRHN